MANSSELQRELMAYQFAPSGEETETTVIWKDARSNQISVAKDYELCPDVIKRIHLEKIRALHSPFAPLMQQAYTVKDHDESMEEELPHS